MNTVCVPAVYCTIVYQAHSSRCVQYSYAFFIFASGYRECMQHGIIMRYAAHAARASSTELRWPPRLRSSCARHGEEKGADNQVD